MSICYLDQLADQIRDQVDQAELPEGDTRGLFRAYAMLVLAKGGDVTPSDVHNAWVSWMLTRDPEHPALVPFVQLPREIAESDIPFVKAIHEVSQHAPA